MNKILTEKKVGLYAGVDPTGPSIHIGHMLPFMILAWAYVWGLPVAFLVCVVLFFFFFFFLLFLFFLWFNQSIAAKMKANTECVIARWFYKQDW